MIALLAIPAVALLLMLSAPAETVSGVGQAKDGDSLLVGDAEVRLFGVDAPEWDQGCTRDGEYWACGAAAKEELSRLVTGKLVFCSSEGRDEHNRLLGRCMVGGTDVNRAMVASGHAIAFRRYSSDYVSAEEAAKLSKVGLWSGQFQAPSDHRRASQAPRKSSGTSTARRGTKTARSLDWAGRANGNCNIKGNRNRKGQWIYHLPGMPYYDQTRAEEIFCTEAEAQAAGYRRAIVR